MTTVEVTGKKDHGEFDESTPHNYVSELLDNPDDVVSANGTTGLLPTPPLNEAQAESYSDLSAVPQAVSQVGKTASPAESQTKGSTKKELQ